MPEQIFERIKKNILPQWKVCFITAIVMGLIAHLYKMINWLPNWDSLVFRHDAQNMIGLGRWFLPFACAPSSFFDLPWITGLLAVLFHALGAVFICRIFDVRKNVTAALIGAMIASFPTVASVMMYNYVADGYAVSFLLACISSFCLVKEKPNFIVAVITIALSVGIYQAYLTVTIMLLLCYLIIGSVHKNISFKELALKSLKFLMAGLFGMMLYYLVLIVVIKCTGIQLSKYQGFEAATSFSGFNIIASLYVIKNSFVKYFFDFSKGITLFCTINVVVFVLTVVLYIIDIIKNKLSLTKIVFLILCVILLPVGASVLALINSDIDYHNLMKMGYCVYYLFFILQYEKADFKNIKLNVIKLWTIFVVTVIMISNEAVIANVCYHHLQMAFEKSYGVLIRIADRIEQTEEAENCDSVLIIGALEESQAYSLDISPDMTGATDGYILRADDEKVGQSVLCSALNDYCGKEYNFLAGEEKDEQLMKAEIRDMDLWPSKDSIKVVDDIIVIKLGNEE